MPWACSWMPPLLLAFLLLEVSGAENHGRCDVLDNDDDTALLQLAVWSDRPALKSLRGNTSQVSTEEKLRVQLSASLSADAIKSCKELRSSLQGMHLGHSDSIAAEKLEQHFEEIFTWVASEIPKPNGVEKLHTELMELANKPGFDESLKRFQDRSAHDAALRAVMDILNSHIRERSKNFTDFLGAGNTSRSESMGTGNIAMFQRKAEVQEMNSHQTTSQKLVPLMLPGAPILQSVINGVTGGLAGGAVQAIVQSMSESVNTVVGDALEQPRKQAERLTQRAAVFAANRKKQAEEQRKKQMMSMMYSYMLWYCQHATNMAYANPSWYNQAAAVGQDWTPEDVRARFQSSVQQWNLRKEQLARQQQLVEQARGFLWSDLGQHLEEVKKDWRQRTAQGSPQGAPGPSMGMAQPF
eukprot:gnl/TRDRNA2_/TRDRNA2_181464_c0_seq1.p1 gnl/TRDRNA2_/TRDRNA2_181464_c0~~gnl/TRDRNA2_/TRDRNA2_181464_c0_seq1.p1  ORF type:complete len:412 (+),score=66.89 gnl/TRDRNA2_/TRDRNA2_181464_c0_seq1:63-1298(+)